MSETSQTGDDLVTTVPRLFLKLHDEASALKDKAESAKRSVALGHLPFPPQWLDMVPEKQARAVVDYWCKGSHFSRMVDEVFAAEKTAHFGKLASRLMEVAKDIRSKTVHNSVTTELYVSQHDVDGWVRVIRETVDKIDYENPLTLLVEKWREERGMERWPEE